MKSSNLAQQYPTSGRSLLIAFGLFLFVFVLTHLVKFPGSLSYFLEVTGGQKILDMSPSFSSAEVYQRLETMGEAGRAAYFRLIFTVDIIFPIVVLIFLRAWTKFSTKYSNLGRKPLKVLIAFPWIYFIFDLLENAFALTMLVHYPEQIPALASVIGYFTVIKRMSMMLALLVPLLIFGGYFLKKRDLNMAQS